MIPVPNQPILFTEKDSTDQFCCVDDRWQQRMFVDDEIFFQFNLDECDGKTQLIENPEFVDGSDWTFENGGQALNGVALLPNGASVSQTSIDTSSGNLFRINLVAAIGSIPNATLIITGFTEQIVLSSFVGTLSVYGQPQGTSTTLTFSFQGEGTEGFAALDSVEMYEVDVPVATMFDCEDVELDEIDATIQTNGLQAFASFAYSPNVDVINAGAFYIDVNRTCEDDYVSELICVIESNDCDLLIGGCSETNFDSDDFLPVIRLRGELMKGTNYDFKNRFAYQDNNGRFRNAYTRRNKKYMIKLELVPEHVRDFIYSLPLMNEIGVREGQNDQYYMFCDDVPDEPLFPEGEKNLSSITLEVVRAEVDETSTFKAGCSSVIPPFVIGNRSAQRAIQTDPVGGEELINANSN